MVTPSTPSTGRGYSAALALHDDIAAVRCTMSVFLFTMQCIYVMCVCLSQAIHQCGYPLPPRLWDSNRSPAALGCLPPHVLTDQSNSAATQDEAEDEAEVCMLCCQRRSTIIVCGECEEHYCAECIDTHTCGTNVVC